jgi:hypothetical protein
VSAGSAKLRLARIANRREARGLEESFSTMESFSTVAQVCRRVADITVEATSQIAVWSGNS